MGYAKVVADAGYQYHMYTLGNATFGYGVNSEGLATSGATINADQATMTYGQNYTSNWKSSGKFVAPLATHMMLASCKNVEEAIAFIENPLAPFDFEGNMLISDRDGNAAILESVGIYHQIIRYDHSPGIFASGNYPHRRADGMFDIGSGWGWAANTMLREWRLNQILEELGGQVSLADAFRIMAEQSEPGNITQLGFDNPGSLSSTNSYMAVSRTGELWISDGPPNLVEYVRYALDAIPEPGMSAVMVAIAMGLLGRRRG
jgi:hypothetical protein